MSLTSIKQDQFGFDCLVQFSRFDWPLAEVAQFGGVATLNRRQSIQLMPDNSPLATCQYVPGQVEEVLEFLKRTRNELRMLRRVRVWTDHLRVYDVNGDCFEVTGVGYPDEDVKPLLDAVHTSYKPEAIHNEFSGPYKEFKTGKRRPWAEDRVM